MAKGKSAGKKTPPKPALNHQQQVFVDEYLRCWNASEAARRAGYSVKTAYAAGYRLLRKREVLELVEQRLREKAMSAAEVIARLSDEARGSQAPFIRITDDGHVEYDFSHPEAKEHLYLIKKIRTKRKRMIEGTGKDAQSWEHEWVEVELYDAQHAKDLLGKFHKLWFEKDETPALNLNIDFSKLSIEQIRAIRNAKTREEILAIVADTDASTG